MLHSSDVKHMLASELGRKQRRKMEYGATQHVKTSPSTLTAGVLWIGWVILEEWSSLFQGRTVEPAFTAPVAHWVFPLFFGR